MILAHLSLYRTKTNNNHPILDDISCHPILDDSSHPLFEPLDLAFKCRQNVDEIWHDKSIYTSQFYADYLHLACFAYPYFAIQERVLHETYSYLASCMQPVL